MIVAALHGVGTEIDDAPHMHNGAGSFPKVEVVLKDCWRRTCTHAAAVTYIMKKRWHFS